MRPNPRGLPSSWVQPDFRFDPWQYGNGESKETHLWVGGGFIMPAPTDLLRPFEVKTSTWEMTLGPARGHLRSLTPEGFARAVFEANEPRVRARVA